MHYFHVALFKGVFTYIMFLSHHLKWRSFFLFSCGIFGLCLVCFWFHFRFVFCFSLLFVLKVTAASGRRQQPHTILQTYRCIYSESNDKRIVEIAVSLNRNNLFKVRVYALSQVFIFNMGRNPFKTCFWVQIV